MTSADGKRHEVSSDFTRVDRVADPREFVRTLDTMGALDFFARCKRQTYAWLEIQAGAQLLDVGCGVGDDVRALAEIVGSTGLVVGIDSSETMIAEARARATGADLPVEYHVGDGHHLPFPDNSFDGCRTERTLHHVNQPEQVLAEMVRVARPGARVVAFEPDFETWVVDGPDRRVARAIANSWCDSFGDGWVGRRLPALFRDCGVTDIGVTPETLMLTDYNVAANILGLGPTVARAQAAGVVSEAEGARWLAQLEQAGQTGRFFAAATLFGVYGRKA